jgi:hypothetical protein
MNIELAAALVPYVSAAIGRYGGGAMSPARAAGPDPGGDSTVEVGRALLRCLVGPRGSAAVRAAVEELTADPADDERVAALRVQLRRALAADPALAGAAAEVLSAAGVAINAAGGGDGAVAVRTVSDVQSGEWPIIRPR